MKFYVLQGNMQGNWVANPKFELRKVVCLEVKNNKLKIDKDLSLDFEGYEKIDNFMYNLSFSTPNTKSRFKAFLSLDDLNAYVKQKVESKEMEDLRR